MAYTFPADLRDSITWNDKGQMVITKTGEVLTPTKDQSKDPNFLKQYTRETGLTWLTANDLKYLLWDTYGYGIRPGWATGAAYARGRYEEDIRNFEKYGHTHGAQPWGPSEDWLHDYAATKEAERREAERIKKEEQDEIKRKQEEAFSALPPEKVKPPTGEPGSINWNKKDGWVIQQEKTDYKTDHKTNYRTDYKYGVDRKACGGWGPWRRCHRWTDWYPDEARNGPNRGKNATNKRKNADNKILNSKNIKRNTGYATTVRTATSTKGGDYVSQRQAIRNVNLDSSDSDLKKRFENLYKDYYREGHLEEWDTSLGRKPLYGEFDHNYYTAETSPGRNAKSQWDEAKRIDDIDITERYGSNSNYYLQHYTNQAANVRGNAAEVTKAANDYLEKKPTDQEINTARTLQLGVDLDTQTERLLNIPYVAEEWEKAKRDDPHWRKLGKEKFLDVKKPDDFAALFRLSERPDDQQIKLDYNVNAGYGITQLEDAVNEAAGEKAIVDTKKFGALTQAVLKDTLQEMKEAKAKEEMLQTMSGFAGFSEIMDINKTLSDTILGDTGVGGYLSFISGGKSEEALEKSLMGITGVGNNIKHNWQKWYEEELTQKYNKEIELGIDPKDASQTITIEADFAKDFVNEYLDKRFNTSRSMDEFVEYLDVRQAEQNPFQTQDALTAIKNVADMRATKYLDDIKQIGDKRFNTDFYFDPIGNSARGKDWTKDSNMASYAEQKDTVEKDWALAKTGDAYWKQQAYRFGIDINNKDQFARMHFQIVGQGKGYDGAEDTLNAGKIKDHIYNNILPALNDEALKNPTVFGQFITPEEFADDMLSGLDPNDKSGWDEILERYGLKDFKGDFDELREHIMNALRTGSAQEIREKIKYLNEKRQKPEQRVLGVTYIEREEDYKDEPAKAETELYSVFQGAGFQGTEDEFYDNFFPDLERSDMRLLTQAGKDQKLKSFGLDLTDPFASLGTIESFFDDDKEEEISQTDKDKGKSYFSFQDDDDEWEYRPKKKEDEVLAEFTTMFEGL